MNDSGFAERGGYQDPSKIELSEVEVVKSEPMNEWTNVSTFLVLLPFLTNAQKTAHL